ncbi:MAG: VOC family protein [Alphaproteobacteria bacterium]
MAAPIFVPTDDIRARFSRAMSRMYRQEVPAYGALCDLVADVNLRHLHGKDGALARITEERHGAIRLGTARELRFMRRLFAVMGMHPVGYYDLSVAGLPVHSTAFRPVDAAALEKNPFRVFTSLLRVDLLDESIRNEATAVLDAREIFTPEVRLLVEKAEASGGLSEADTAGFIREALETFRWHDEALVPHALYQRLAAAHPLIADIVSFKGPHINHLTPRTLDIDAIQRLMPEHGMTPKEAIEGPPRRDVPILLRQTSFKALVEAISFPAAGGTRVAGKHTARFGEIEQRGAALTPKGRALYDALLTEARALSHGKLTHEAQNILAERFATFPDDHTAMREQGLAYFEYVPTGRRGRAVRDGQIPTTADALVRTGLATARPIVYEDFLPVSAAGIFRSNLGQGGNGAFQANPNKAAFEEALGAPVLDEFALYAQMERASIKRCLETLLPPVRAA